MSYGRNQFKFKVPGFSYPGGKVRLRRWLLPMMPKKGRTYVEPFAGRGNVFWLAACALEFGRWWLNDPETAEWFHAIERCDLSSLPVNMRAFDFHECAKRALAGDLNARAMESKVSDAGMSFAVDIKPSLQIIGSGRFRKTSGQEFYSYDVRSFRNSIRFARRILRARKPQITALDYTEVLADLGSSDFAYIDPPYLGVTCPYVGDINHNVLLAVLKDSRCKWLLSGIDTDVYRAALGPPVARRSRSVGMNMAEGRRAKRLVECVWSNYL
jgi:DNA adenine methylase